MPGEARWVFAGESNSVHLSGYFEAAVAVGPFARLCFHQSGRAAEGPAAGVESHALFADPDNAGAAFTQQAHRLMSDAGARTEQESSNGGRRDVGNASGVFGCDGVVVAMQKASLQIDERKPFPHAGELIWRRGTQLTDGCHVRPSRASSDHSRMPWP